MTPNDHANRCSLRSCMTKMTYRSVAWWILLLMAVLVVPSIALVLTGLLNMTGTSEIGIFVATCLLCVYLGMRLLRHEKLAPLVFERITVSEPLRQHTLNMVSMIETETGKWKSRYDKCEPVFMNLSKKPAWDYLDEVVQLMERIRQSMEKDATVNLEDIKDLNAWVESSKPSVLDGYLHTLEATYVYAKAEYTQQGKQIDELFPELGRGHITTFVKAPSYANSFAHELLNTLKQEHPFLAQSPVVGKSAKPGV